ncbi:MAG TPA: hypothetical protein VKJ47_10015 [Candidatus Binatia bacterium]|nr:hypothetical protein [Candidatus Binatia bacterium]
MAGGAKSQYPFVLPYLLLRTLTPAKVANPPLAAVRAAKARTAQLP